MNADPVPLFAHVPFLLDDMASYADLHLVRSNPIARALSSANQNARLAVTAPDSCISPDWYGTEDQVPTWNYVAVHFIGKLELQPQEHLHALLDWQSAHFESQLLPKTPWTSDKMSEGVMEKMMRAIVPVPFYIEDMQSTWKLGQNKPELVRKSAAQHVAEHNLGSDTSTLAQWMQTPSSSK